MAQHLPYTGPLHVQYLKFAASLPYPVQPIDVRSPAWSALGHAIDYRLRLSLGSGLGDAVDQGIRLIGSTSDIPGAPDPQTRAALFAVGNALTDAVNAHLAGHVQFNDERLSRLCFVAAFYEEVYRTGRVQRRSMLLDATPNATLTELTDAVPGYVIEDLAKQFALSARPFAPLRALSAGERICGPIFAGSGDLGGADADYILGGLLLDCKATRHLATSAATSSTSSPDTSCATTTTSTASITSASTSPDKEE